MKTKEIRENVPIFICFIQFDCYFRGNVIDKIFLNVSIEAIIRGGGGGQKFDYLDVYYNTIKLIIIN